MRPQEVRMVDGELLIRREYKPPWRPKLTPEEMASEGTAFRAYMAGVARYGFGLQAEGWPR